MRPRRHSWLAIASAVAVVSAVMPWGPGQVARAGVDRLEVTTTDDELNADGDCSLREAVTAANTNVAVDACRAGVPGGDTIFLQPLTYTLAIPGRDEDAAATGDLDLVESTSLTTIENGALGWATIDAAGIDRVLDVLPGSVRWSLSEIEITGGDADAGEGGGIRVRDGVCDDDGNPGGAGHLESMTIRGNRAERGGGLHLGSCQYPWIRWVSIVQNAATTDGGGVSVTSGTNFRLGVSTVSTNAAGGLGGGIWNGGADDSLTLNHVTLAENTAPDGAALWSASWPSLLDTLVARNHGPACGGPNPAGPSGMSDDASCLGLSNVSDAGVLALTQVGKVYVHPLGLTSPAIDGAGAPFPMWCESESASDQLGTLWPLDGNGDGIEYCDVGAFEAAAIPVVAPSPPPLPDTALPFGADIWSPAPATMRAFDERQRGIGLR